MEQLLVRLIVEAALAIAGVLIAQVMRRLAEARLTPA